MKYLDLVFEYNKKALVGKGRGLNSLGVLEEHKKVCEYLIAIQILQLFTHRPDNDYRLFVIKPTQA